MFTKTRKVLFCSEASFANTGFGQIYQEILTRLSKDKRFRIAEFGSDAFVNDPRDEAVKWRFYPNAVLDDDPRHQAYKGTHANKFGRWRFDKVLLDFEPDIVIDLRDPPFFQHENLSPLRPFFYWCIAPTVDSDPQPGDWVRMFKDADAVMPYTQYGYDVLQQEHPGINLYNGYGPGINLDTFKPRNQQAARQQLGVPQDCRLIGYVSRNQGRKLFPELLKAFRQCLDMGADKNTYLHLHTATPDLNTWNLSKLLIEHNLMDNVLFTYYCRECHNTDIRKWQGPMAHCKMCQKKSASHPRTALGCSRETMATIFNCYDLYVQYSNCEGLGIGALEAAASGVPFMAVDYSAMQTLNQSLDGTPINYSLMRSINVDAERAVPDNNDAAQKMFELLELPKPLLASKGQKSRQLAEQHYNYDTIAAKWADFICNVQLKDHQGKWGEQPPQQFVVNQYSGIAKEIADALIKAGRPELIGTNFFFEMYYKTEIAQYGIDPKAISPKELEQVLQAMLEEKRAVDDINLGNVLMPSEDYIQYADIKEMTYL